MLKPEHSWSGGFRPVFFGWVGSTIQILEGVDESGVRAVCFNVRDLKNRLFSNQDGGLVSSES